MRILKVLGLFIIIGLFFSCDNINDLVGLTKDDSVTSELFKDVTVSISGNVTEVDTNSSSGAALDGITVSIVEYESGSSDGNSLGTTTTNPTGGFSFSGITLKVDENTYYLEVDDASDDGDNDNYYANNSTLIYAVRDSELTGYEIKLIPKNPVSLTTVRGIVKDGLDRSTLLENVTVTLTNRFDSSVLYTATSDSAGEWSVSAEVGSYRIEYDGSALTTNYIVEYEDKVLRNSPSNNLGNHFLVPVIDNGEFRVVLQWEDPDTYDLQMYLDVFTSDMPVVNTLGPNGSSILLPSRYTLNPGSGFAQDSSYWPTAVTPSYDRDYVFAQSDDDSYQVGGVDLIGFQRDEINAIEVMTFYQENPLDSFPDRLTYYYEYEAGDSTVFHYPIGVYNLVVQLHQQNEENIYDSQAQVKLYQGSNFMGSFDVGDFNPNFGESNKLSWDVLFIEAGFTNHEPFSTNQLYLRPVPYFSTSMETEQWDQPPFLKQATYKSGSDFLGTEDFGSVTALCYDINWGLFIGTESDGITALFNDGAEPADFAGFTNTDPVIDIEILGEPFILSENAGNGTIRNIEGDEVGGSQPNDINCIYSSSGISGAALIAGSPTGLHAFRWETDWLSLPVGLVNTGNADSIINVTDLYDGGSNEIFPQLVIADGHVYFFDGRQAILYPQGKYDQMAAALEPNPAWGTLIKGGIYGYVDSLLEEHWNIFWGITDENMVYVNAVRVQWGATNNDPNTYTVGTSRLITDQGDNTVYDVEALARPGEDAFGGQPLIATDNGILLVTYNHTEGLTADQTELNTVFGVVPFRFFPSDLSVRDLEIAYETTYIGTGTNGVLHTLGGMF